MKKQDTWRTISIQPIRLHMFLTDGYIYILPMILNRVYGKTIDGTA